MAQIVAQAHRGRANEPARRTVVQQMRSGDLHDRRCCRRPARCIRDGTRSRSNSDPPTAALVDVGTVRASANMTMPGMAMSGGLEVSGQTSPGRYQATAEFGMAGAWQMAIEWDGPAGRGSVNFEGPVQ